MADPKYANLPGLAPDDEPDVYETEDGRPEEDQSEAVVGGLQWELAAAGDPESAVEKFHRLQLEVQQLQGQVEGLKEMKPSSLTGSSSASCDPLAQNTDSLRLQLVEANLTLLLQNPSQDVHEVSSLLSTGDGAATYQLDVNRKDGAVVAHDSTALADLEKRLQLLEQVVGNAPAKMSRLCPAASDQSSSSLLPAVAELSSQLSRLDPAAVERTEAPLQQLHRRMNQLADVRQELVAQQQGSEKLQQVELLAGIVGRMDGGQHELGTITDRLEALQHIHTQAGGFSQLLTDLERVQLQLDKQLDAREKQLQQVRSSCCEQLSQVSGQLIQQTKQAGR